MRRLAKPLVFLLLGLSSPIRADDGQKGLCQIKHNYSRPSGNSDRQVVAKGRGGVCGLGVGFLWTNESQQLVGKLTTDKDFVDLVLGPGKLHVFNLVKSPARVACIARSLEENDVRPFPGIRETIEMLRQADVASERVIIAYNPERQPGTPRQELDDLVASARRAKDMARAYGAPLLIGPGLREMQQREHLYAELAKHCDIWLIQAQRLQLDPVTRAPVSVDRFRAEVKRIIDRLRAGNPNIRIVVQLVTTARRGTSVLTADEIAGFAKSVEGLVEAVRIYGGSKELLSQVIDRLRGAPATGSTTGDDLHPERPGLGLDAHTSHENLPSVIREGESFHE